MSPKTITQKNLEMLEEFMKYAREHPEIMDRIPKDAQLILLPENDPELLQANQAIIEECKRAGKRFVVFRMKIPERSMPKLEEIY